MGSGLVLSKDGYIVTNYHVVEKASKIFIKIYNGSQYEVDFNNVYIDKLTDIAVIKINVDEILDVPDIGDSSNLLVGEDVIALGNPLGLFNASNKLTATKGIISAIDVSFGFNKTSGSVYQDMIQTDASINPGNSGGPLLNLDGEIIGLNTFVISGSDNMGSIGLNFAIPINRVIDIYNDLKDKGFVDRQFNTGIKVKEIDHVLSQYLRLNSTDGMLVVDVEKNLPVKKQELK
jgi:serine protease Do